jgi:hypothetical protein
MTPLDYTHQANVWFDHAFNESLKLNITDSIVVAQDPQLVDGGSLVRVEGNNVVNDANVKLNKEWTRQFSTSTYYGNRLVVYSSNDGISSGGLNPSSAGLLNRMEQRVGTDLQWTFTPETMGLVGYQYSWVGYTGDELLAPQSFYNVENRLVTYTSQSRNYNAHYAYIGANHLFTGNLSAAAKVGATFVDMYADPVSPSDSVAPYADISITYTYAFGSYAQLGCRQDMSTTSFAAPGSDFHLTQYQESSIFYFDITHRINPRLSATLITQYNCRRFKQGAYSGQPENHVHAGVNLDYKINRHFSAEVGYNFDELFSTVPGRSYTRNLVYLGLTASY